MYAETKCPMCGKEFLVRLSVRAIDGRSRPAKDGWGVTMPSMAANPYVPCPHCGADLRLQWQADTVKGPAGGAAGPDGASDAVAALEAVSSVLGQAATLQRSLGAEQ